MHLIGGRGGARRNLDECAGDGAVHILDEDTATSVLELDGLADEGFLQRIGGGARCRRRRRRSRLDNFEDENGCFDCRGLKDADARGVDEGGVRDGRTNEGGLGLRGGEDIGPVLDVEKTGGVDEMLLVVNGEEHRGDDDEEKEGGDGIHRMRLK